MNEQDCYKHKGLKLNFRIKCITNWSRSEGIKDVMHALIIFNFEEERFEIKCLSRKYPVYVNRKPLTFEDPPRPLLSGSIVAISSESFFFMLPPVQD